jgi:hypothetical protein
MPSERDRASGNPYKSPLPESRPKGAFRITAIIGLACSMAPFGLSVFLFHSFATRRFKDGVTLLGHLTSVKDPSPSRHKSGGVLKQMVKIQCTAKSYKRL